MLSWGDGLSSVGPILVNDGFAVDVALTDDPAYPGDLYRVGVTFKQAVTGSTTNSWLYQYEIKMQPAVPAISLQLQQRRNLGPSPVGSGNVRIDAVPNESLGGRLKPFPANGQVYGHVSQYE